MLETSSGLVTISRNRVVLVVAALLIRWCTHDILVVQVLLTAPGFSHPNIKWPVFPGISMVSQQNLDPHHPCKHIYKDANKGQYLVFTVIGEYNGVI